MYTFDDFREVIRLTAIVAICAVASASLVIALGSSPHLAPAADAGEGALVQVANFAIEPGR